MSLISSRSSISTAWPTTWGYICFVNAYLGSLFSAIFKGGNSQHTVYGNWFEVSHIVPYFISGFTTASMNLSNFYTASCDCLNNQYIHYLTCLKVQAIKSFCISEHVNSVIQKVAI